MRRKAGRPRPGASSRPTPAQACTTSLSPRPTCCACRGRLRGAAGAPLLPMPVNYYDDLSARWGLDDATLAACRNGRLALRSRRARASSGTSTPTRSMSASSSRPCSARRLCRLRRRQRARARRRPGAPTPRRTHSVADPVGRTQTMVPQNEFIQRDRGQHPPALTPDYKTSVLRSPRLALWSLQNSLSEITGPVFGRRGTGTARSRPDPELRQDRRADRRTHHRAWPRAGRERPRCSQHAGRGVAGQCRRTLPAQERHLPRADRSEFRRLRTHDHR